MELRIQFINDLHRRLQIGLYMLAPVKFIRRHHVAGFARRKDRPVWRHDNIVLAAKLFYPVFRPAELTAGLF